MIEKVNTLIANDSEYNNIYTEYIIELFYDLMYKINEQKKIITKNNNLDKKAQGRYNITIIILLRY